MRAWVCADRASPGVAQPVVDLMLFLSIVEMAWAGLPFAMCSWAMASVSTQNLFVVESLNVPEGEKKIK
jgi:hypothetical protein